MKRGDISYLVLRFYLPTTKVNPRAKARPFRVKGLTVAVVCVYWRRQIGVTTEIIMILCHASTLAEVKVGDVVTDFRGDVATVKGWSQPQHMGSTGRVITDQGVFYPSVYNLTWFDK